MVINNLKADGRRLIKEKGETFVSLGEKLDVPYQNIQKWCDYASVNKRFVELVEMLGYDIEIHYVTRKG